VQTAKDEERNFIVMRVSDSSQAAGVCSSPGLQFVRCRGAGVQSCR